MDRDHNLGLVPEKYRKVVSVLLKWEDTLSDGYKYYCEFVTSEQADQFYDGDFVLAILVEVAKDILEEGNTKQSDIDQLVQAFLVDPETGDGMEITSPPSDEGHGEYSFDVTNVKTGTRWRHLVLTYEIN